MELEALFAVIGLILSVVYFFVPDHRIMAGAGTSLGLALVYVWILN
jgi:hypothetical protein